MKPNKIKINKIKENTSNPRFIAKDKFKKLVKSLQEFPEMLKLRPIVVDNNNIILGGNMRYKAALELGMEDIWVIQADDLSEKQKQEFIIKDNSSFGDWDFEILANEWDIESLEDWGVNVPSIKNTELLSGLEYKPMYYEPKEIPNINLQDCIDLTKYKEKIKALDEYKLSSEQKEILKMFAYRFIKIDFEQVANYYYFNASDEEQKAIERLRLVLTDNGLNGFIQDDLIRILNFTDEDIK
tara:strand:+ start:255 stop:977 length:723 start_codon:yes stop_codon:yes gene_type:complete